MKEANSSDEVPGLEHPLFHSTRKSSQGSWPLSALQVKASVDAYQMDLDEQLRVNWPIEGLISAGRVLAWIRAGASPNELHHWIDCDASESQAAPQQEAPPGRDFSHLDSKASRSSSVSRVARVAWDFCCDVDTWIWTWAGYCTVGIASEIFVESNPKLAFIDVAKSSVLALGGAAILIAATVVFFSGMIPRRSKSIWSDIVISVFAIVLTIVSTSAYFRALDHLRANQLAPVSVLAARCMEEGKVSSTYRSGAVCADGTRSSAKGRGACAHHDGVSYWVYPRRQTRTIHQCKVMAEEISWR